MKRALQPLAIPVKRILWPLSIVAAVAALAFLGWSLVSSWSGLSQQIETASPVPIALGVALILLQTVLVAAIWRDVLRIFGATATLPQSYHLIFLAALGKYLPGKVWAIGGIALLAQNSGIPLRAATIASTATIALIAAGGAVVGGLAYLLWQLALGTPAIIAATTATAILPWLAARGLQVRAIRATDPAVNRLARFNPLRTGRPVLEPSPRNLHPSSQPVRRPPTFHLQPALDAVAASNASWLILALANWSIVCAIEPVPIDLLPPLLASAALGWAAGALAIAVPAGIGVREAVQALALADVLPPATAAAFALLVRFALILADLLAAAVAWAIRPRTTAVEARAPLPDY